MMTKRMNLALHDEQRAMIVNNFHTMRQLWINHTQWHCFEFVRDNPGARTPALAKHLGISTQNAAKLVLSLYHKCYLDRERVINGHGSVKYAYYSKIQNIKRTI